MDSNFASAGGGVVGAAAAGGGVSASVSGRYNAVNCQRSVAYNAYDPYGGSSSGVRTSSVYPYDAEAEFKERTGMGKAKATGHHLQMAGNTHTNSVKMQQHTYNSCYGAFNQNTVGLTPESANYYAYAYEQQQQHHHYQQQQQQYHQSQVQQQYKYNVSSKQAAAQQQSHNHHQQQQQSLAASSVTAMKMSPPEYGYAPYHHPYYHPHYHHPPSSQKGGVGVMKTIPDASAIPYVNSKMIHSAAMGGARAPQYPSNYAYHPAHGYPSAGHHTYQSQSVCDDSRWVWNGSEYQSSCRNAYPSAAAAYVNGSAGVKQQTVMWPSMPMQYQNTMPTGYPSAAAAVANQSCCSSMQSAAAAAAAAATYYPQQYVKYPVQSLPTAMDYNGSSNDLYSSSQGNSAAIGSAKVYTDLIAQPQAANAYQTTSVSYHQQPGGDYTTSATLDYNARYLQEQQTESPSSSSTSSTSSYNHHYYHPYAHQTYSTAEPQEELYTQQQVDTKIGLTTKSQSLRDFLTSWNEDEDECSDRTMSSTDVPFMEQLHLTAADHFTQTQDSPIVENHLQFKGSFTSRPKIHVGITVDSTVESDQYINLPDIIIDIEKSNKDVVTSLPDDIIVAKMEKENDDKPPPPPPLPAAAAIAEEVQQPTEAEPEAPPPKKLNELLREKRKFRRKFLSCKRIPHQQKLRLIQRNQRKIKVPRKLQLRPKIRRVKKQSRIERLQLFNPQSLKCLCVSLINSDKFRNRILGPSEIDNLINLTTATDNEVNIDVAVALAATTAVSSSTSSSSSVIPKLSDLCKNALNSSFDRDVLVINLDEILDSDNLFVVQCDINENILENYIDTDHQQQLHQHEDPQHQHQQQHDDLVEILNDNNNNYNRGGNYIASESITASTTNGHRDITVTPTIEELKRRSCSVTEVSNLPLDNAVEHNNFNLTNHQTLVHPSPPSSPPGYGSSSCPAALYASPAPPPPPLPPSPPSSLSLSLSSAAAPSSLLIEQNCPTTQQITVGHEQLHEMLMVSAGIVHDEDDRHHLHHDSSTILDNDDGELLMLASSSAVATPSTIHHEEIVPDNLKKFQNEKFLKYLHAKYVQGNLSEFYHANRIIKKYKKRIIKKILNIVR